MKQLVDFKEEIHKCSRCGICQGQCPIFKITGNDCSVSKGLFVMLEGFLTGKLRMSKTINRYLDLCLRCGACSKICPSGIDIIEVITSAKAEYFKNNFFEKLKSLFKKYIIFGLGLNIMRFFNRTIKSKSYEKKVIYFGGCGSKIRRVDTIIKIFNSQNIEVINPNFSCCGVPYFTSGDLNEYYKSIKKYIKILKKYNINEVVTTCASCEKSLKDYIKWADEEDQDFLKNIKVVNIYEYFKFKNLQLELNQPQKITYHKPCNINNYDDVKYFLENIKNLEYVEMQSYDNCCGLNGVSKFNEFDIMSEIFISKKESILNTGCENVLTSCLGCEAALKIYSRKDYKVFDVFEFLDKYLIDYR